MDFDADVWWAKGGGSRPNNPLADDPGPIGEYPDVPPRSGVEAVLNAANAAASATAVPVRSDHERNLQNAIDDIRTWCHGKHAVGAIEITNIIRSHHV